MHCPVPPQDSLHSSSFQHISLLQGASLPGCLLWCREQTFRDGRNMRYGTEIWHKEDSVGERKVQKQTTQKQPTRNYGDRWQRHVSRKRAACCVSQRKRLDFFVQTQGTVWRGKRDTLLEGHSGFLLFRLAEADGTGTVPCGRPFPYFFFPFFFSFFVLWAGSLASKDNFPWTPCANCAVFLLESVYKTK